MGKVYRLWCGKKRYGPWREDLGELLRLAIRLGLAYPGKDDTCNLGPLTWIETGERRYAKSRTVSHGKAGTLP